MAVPLQGSWFWALVVPGPWHKHSALLGASGQNRVCWAADDLASKNREVRALTTVTCLPARPHFPGVVGPREEPSLVPDSTVSQQVAVAFPHPERYMTKW